MLLYFLIEKIYSALGSFLYTLDCHELQMKAIYGTEADSAGLGSAMFQDYSLWFSTSLVILKCIKDRRGDSFVGNKCIGDLFRKMR